MDRCFGDSARRLLRARRSDLQLSGQLADGDSFQRLQLQQLRAVVVGQDHGQGAMNSFAEPGELQNLYPKREIVMTPERANQLCLWGEYILDILDRPDVPADLRTRAARILKLSPRELPYTPPRVPVSQFAEAVHLADE